MRHLAESDSLKPLDSEIVKLFVTKTGDVLHLTVDVDGNDSISIENDAIFGQHKQHTTEVYRCVCVCVRVYVCVYVCCLKDVEYILVIATRLEVFLVGLGFDGNNVNGETKIYPSDFFFVYLICLICLV